MIRAVIVDDEPLARERVRTLAERCADLTVVAESADGADAVSTLAALRPDLVFLDVQMPELDGFEVLNRLAPETRPAVIFVTAYDEHAIDAFAVHAVDYLLKPIDPGRFDDAVARARVRLAGPPGRHGVDVDRLVAELARLRSFPERLTARLGNSLTFVPVAEIDWIEARGNYARLHVGSAIHLIREPMKSLEARLDPHRFIRIHRGTIVNLDRIASVEPYFHGEYVVKLRDGTQLTTSRSLSPRFRALLK